MLNIKILIDRGNEKMNEFLEKLKTTRILACVGTICMFFGAVISYARVTAWGYSANVHLYNHFEGIIIVIIAIINFLFIFKDIVANYIPKLFEIGIGKKIAEMNSSKLSLISTGIVILLAVILHMRLDFSIARFVLGFYVLYFGVICLGLFGILHKQNG